MSCVYVGEMTFPFPFSILIAILTLGLIIARIIKSETSLAITLLALNDMVLKLNWIFLLPYLLATGNSYISSSIIAYCLFASLIVNLILWRITFQNNFFDSDSKFKLYTQKFPCFYRTLLIVSYTFSFEAFRFTYSRLLGKKCFSAGFSERKTDLMRLLG